MQWDLESLLVTVPSEVPLRQLEGAARKKGYTLGYRPKTSSGRRQTVKDVLERRLPNSLEKLFGGIEDLCTALKVRRGKDVIVTRNVPRAATGPDFKKIFIGSKGRYGEILEATLRIFKKT